MNLSLSSGPAPRSPKSTSALQTLSSKVHARPKRVLTAIKIAWLVSFALVFMAIIYSNPNPFTLIGAYVLADLMNGRINLEVADLRSLLGLAKENTVGYGSRTQTSEMILSLALLGGIVLGLLSQTVANAELIYVSTYTPFIVVFLAAIIRLLAICCKRFPPNGDSAS